MREAAALLQWYVDAGVEDALDDEPRNYFLDSDDRQPREDGNTKVKPPAGAYPREAAGKIERNEGAPPQSAPPVALAAVAPARPASLAAAIADARKLADEATTLAELEAAVRGFDGCAIKRTATNTVFCDGNPASRFMLIGEAPGAQEDAQGIPFCGPSGKLLDKMLAAIGYDRTSAYITNTLFWRPPGNRQPSSDELAICKPFVEKHVALIDPRLIVLVGGTATKAVLGTEQGITRLRGKRYTYRTPYSDREYPVAVVYHPSYLLRQPSHKRVTWQDLLAIKRQLSAAGDK